MTQAFLKSRPVSGKIAFQGERGAYSHQATHALFPGADVLPCPTFERALEAVTDSSAELAVIPIENSTAGRVADMHHLLPGSGLFIIGEHFSPIRHALLAVPGATLADLRQVTSHVQALHQCRVRLNAMGLETVQNTDTAGAARQVAEQKTKALAAIASELAATEYGLEVLVSNLQDRDENTTRFIVLAREPNDTALLERPVMTAFTFEVRNIPAALFKAMGGFATNGVNMTKLESYYDSLAFTASAFYAEIEGQPGDAAVDRAMDELRFHSKKVQMLGTFEQVRKRGLSD